MIFGDPGSCLMFNSWQDAAITGGFTWSALMLTVMLRAMLPRVEIWNWKGLLQDLSVVGFVGTIWFFCLTVTLKRWLDLPLSVTAVAILVMAITLTPIAYRVHQIAKGEA